MLRLFICLIPYRRLDIMRFISVIALGLFTSPIDYTNWVMLQKKRICIPVLFIKGKSIRTLN